ncbi:MAG: hypothetical protein RIT05_129 [Bacteroidota bacterium]|jgi:hypothetical protein
MKHYLFAFLITFSALLVVQLPVFAQKNSKGINIELGGGVSLASAHVGGFYAHSSESTSRFAFGFFADKKLIGGLSARSGFFYNGLGRAHKAGEMEMQDEFSFFTIPLQAKYSFKKSPFSFYAGPQFSYLINATARPDASTRSLMTENFQRVNVSAAGGLLCAFTNRFSMGFEYQSSIGSNLDKEYAAILPADTKYQLNAYSLRAFYKLSK